MIREKLRTIESAVEPAHSKMNDHSVASITDAKSLVSVPRAVATGSGHSTVLHDPVAILDFVKTLTTSPKGRVEKTLRGTDTSSRNASLGDYFENSYEVYSAQFSSVD